MWRLWMFFYTWKDNPGNKMVRCGVITVSLFFFFIVVSERFRVSANLFLGGLIVVLIFAFATLFFAAAKVTKLLRVKKTPGNFLSGGEQ